MTQDPGRAVPSTQMHTLKGAAPRCAGAPPLTPWFASPRARATQGPGQPKGMAGEHGWSTGLVGRRARLGGTVLAAALRINHVAASILEPAHLRACALVQDAPFLGSATDAHGAQPRAKLFHTAADALVRLIRGRRCCVACRTDRGGRGGRLDCAWRLQRRP